MKIEWDLVETLAGDGTVTTEYGDEVPVRYVVRVYAGKERFSPPSGESWIPTGMKRLEARIRHDQRLRSTTPRPLRTLVLRLEDGRRLNLTVVLTVNGGLVDEVSVGNGFLPPE